MRLARFALLILFILRIWCYSDRAHGAHQHGVISSSVASVRADNGRLQASVNSLQDMNGELQTSIHRLTAEHAVENKKLTAEISALKEGKRKYDQLRQSSLPSSFLAPPLRVSTDEGIEDGGSSWKDKHDECRRELDLKKAEHQRLCIRKSHLDNEVVVMENALFSQSGLIKHLQAKCRGFGMTDEALELLKTLPPPQDTISSQ